MHTSTFQRKSLASRQKINSISASYLQFYPKIGCPDCSNSAIDEHQKSQNLQILAFFFTCLQKQPYIGYFPKKIEV